VVSAGGGDAAVGLRGKTNVEGVRAGGAHGEDSAASGESARGGSGWVRCWLPS
jgi:hypothetical protein